MNKQVLMIRSFHAMILLAALACCSALAQDEESIKLARLHPLPVEYLEFDIWKAIDTEIEAKITNPKELKRFQEKNKRSELLDSAWEGVEMGNGLWKEGKKINARWCWLRTAIVYWNTDASFASIMNIGNTSIDTGNPDGAMLAFTAMLALPSPQHRVSRSKDIENFRHSACLALCDLNLEQGNYDESLRYVKLATWTYGPDSNCGTWYVSILQDLFKRTKVIDEAKRLHAQVEWTDRD